MGRLRGQLSWLANGQRNTESVLASLTTDLQALQQQVATLDRRVQDLASGQEQLTARQLDGFDALRDGIGQAVDDLAGRIAALQARS